MNISEANALFSIVRSLDRGCPPDERAAGLDGIEFLADRARSALMAGANGKEASKVLLRTQRG